MDWKQATIKRFLGRLVEKGVPNTEREGRKFIYTTNIEEKEAVEIIQTIFSTVFVEKECRMGREYH